ncbi:MAG: aminoacyl-tRNA hydrolase, partial [Calditrichaeota bacterium]
GSQYVLTRHNVGFMLVDYLAESLGANFRGGRGEYVYASVNLAQKKVYLVKPVTYMTLSGYGVRQAADYWRVETDRLLVVYDDFHLQFGKIRLRASGSDGGHKGMRSIIETFGTEDIMRLRIGIGQPDLVEDPVQFVLSNFTRQEQKHLPELLEVCSQAVEVFLEKGIEAAMNQFNSQTFI